MKEFIEFKIDEDLSFWGVIDYPKNIDKRKRYGGALFLHDIGSDFSGPCNLFCNLTEKLNEKDIVTLRISFRGFGESKDHLKDRVIEDHLQDAYKALQWLFSQKYINKEKITIIGHGYGAAIASTITQYHSEIKKLILLSPPENLPKFFIERAYYSTFRPKPGERVFVNSEDVINILEEKGYIDIFGYAYSKHFFESLKNYKPLVDIQNLPEETKVLIIYGTEDKVVGEAPKLLIRTLVGKYHNSMDKYQELPIDGATHYFNSIEHQNYVIEGISDFLEVDK